MALKRIILEMGHGNDMHGGDYTKAALRAVQDAIHHSALPFLRTLKIDPRQLQITVTIAQSVSTGPISISQSRNAPPITQPKPNNRAGT